MYGNLKGWIIAGGLFLVTSLMLFFFARVPPTTPPTGRYKLAEKLTLPSDPKAFLAPMGEACNAAEKYREAIADYKANEDDLGPRGKLATKGSLLAAANPKAIQLVLEATSCSSFDLFKSRPDMVVTYKSNFPDLEAIHRVGKMTITMGAYYQDKDPKKAEEYMKAAFALGYRLYNERVILEEMNKGIDLMRSAATQLAVLAKLQKDESKQQQYTEFADKLDEFGKKQILPLQNAVTSISTATVGTYGGDIHKLADKSDTIDKMWRVEAIMSLGRMKFNTKQRGDQIWAKRLLKEYRNDTDPAVKHAATLADELTFDKYNLLGG